MNEFDEVDRLHKTHNYILIILKFEKEEPECDTSQFFLTESLKFDSNRT